ncbi:hypothetical protein AB0G79_30200 [Streptomyces sp. NPDC020807]|uniref:hypothetical protein n=1 Tax=Streptomyces sp. NPDC020807 TaxID=3155119 RepID=UPI003409BF12
MAPTAPPLEDDPAFRSWLRRVAVLLGEDWNPDPGHRPSLPDGTADFLTGVFIRNGAVPEDHLVPLLAEHRKEVALGVVDALLAQVRRDTGRALRVAVTYDPPGEWGEPLGRLTVGHEAVWGVHPVDLAVGAAEGVQCLLADRDRVLWPVCPDHRVVPHPARDPSGAAVWICAVTRHVTGSIPHA